MAGPASLSPLYLYGGFRMVADECPMNHRGLFDSDFCITALLDVAFLNFFYQRNSLLDIRNDFRERTINFSCQISLFTKKSKNMLMFHLSNGNISENRGKATSSQDYNRFVRWNSNN